MEIVLPWPPSVNGYWRSVGGRAIISRRGRVYRDAVARSVLAARANRHLKGRLELTIDLYPPDRRKRDIDNALKALLDGMQAAGVYQDDSQIDRILIERREIEKGGAVVVKITTIKEKQ